MFPVRNVIRFSSFYENVLILGFKATDKKKTEKAVPLHVRQEVTNLSTIAFDRLLKWLFPRHP